MTEREDTIERIERVLKLTHKKSLTITIPRLTAERAVSLLKEQEAVKPKTGHWNGSECSNCHAVFVRSVFDKPEYCSHCGAKMERTGEVE